MISRGLYIYMVLALLGLTSCVGTEQKSRFVWPAIAEYAKIEFLGVYQSDLDVTYKAPSLLAEAIVGRPPKRPLFGRPMSIATEDGKKLYVADNVPLVVHILNLSEGKIGFLEDEGETYQFGYPGGIAVAGEDVYVVDTKHHHLSLFREDKKLLDFGADFLVRPTGIAVDPVRRRIYVVDTGNHCIAVFNDQHQFLKTIGERGDTPGKFNFPVDVDFDSEGNIFVLDSLNCRVQAFSPEGVLLRSFGERGTARGSFQVPKSLAIDRSSGLVFVTDSLAHKVVVFDTQGNFLLNIGGKFSVASGTIAAGGFYMPHGVEVDLSGGIWVVDSLNQSVQHFQYLNDDYLRVHPLRAEQIFVPR